MAEVLVEYTDVVVTAEGARYTARACGAEMDNGKWQGWLEFIDTDTGNAVRTARETTQPNRTDTLYWATGLTAVYLEGALQRALHPLTKPADRPTPPPRFSEPAPYMQEEADAPVTDSVLNPFSVYRNGETMLRRQLSALSVWHLVNIIRAHRLSELPSSNLNAMGAVDLIELIVAAVKRNTEPVSG